MGLLDALQVFSKPHHMLEMTRSFEEFCLGWLTFEVQYFWVILPALDTVWVTILPSSGIHGPQIPPCFWEDTRATVGSICLSPKCVLKTVCSAPLLYHDCSDWPFMICLYLSRNFYSNWSLNSDRQMINFCQVVFLPRGGWVMFC